MFWLAIMVGIGVAGYLHFRRMQDGAAGEGRAMSAREAREVLGVAADATAQDIRSAYTRLMRSMHPDAGGTDYMAGKLNEAKRVLLQVNKV